MGQRVSFYIDGYNFYCGLKKRAGRRWLWLDYGTMCRRMLKPHQTLVSIHICTTPVRADPQARSRQLTYWHALESDPAVQIHEGFHARRQRTCPKCGGVEQTFEEKQTDSWIASLIVADALTDRTDLIILMAGDSDHIPPVRTVRAERPNTAVIVAWPPHRKSNELGKVANASFPVSDRLIRTSQFPATVRLPDGHVLRRPTTWT